METGFYIDYNSLDSAYWILWLFGSCPEVVTKSEYRARKCGLYVVWWNLFLRAKQQQEQITQNHVQALFPSSVIVNII